MANEDSHSFNLEISQIETQKAVHDTNQVLDFTLGNFDYTKLGFSENRSKQRNDSEKLKNLREAFAAKNQVSDIQMEDQDKIEQISKSPSEQVISVATTNVRDLRNTLTFLTDNDDARVIGKLIAKISKEADVYAIAYEPGKNERIEVRLGIILDTIQKSGIIFV
ncbi:putative tabersonine 16-O-methyltransferase-like [Capsicum annuum]|nr:putative tabersonine 16-O-methyltransferase-like [Capsicum annuum]